jgi:CRP/FNR family cyclic AMP-dependent transcriptional regulator
VPPDPPTFLERLPAASLGRLDAMSTPRLLRPGAALVLEGDVANRVWLVRAGLVKVVSNHRDGHEPILGLRGADDLIGELGALDGSPRSATVTALTPTTLQEFGADDFRTWLRQDPDAAAALMAHMAVRLRESDAFRVSYVGDDVPTRLARCLLDLGRRHGEASADGTVQITLPLSQKDLAGLVMASRDAVAKTLRSWRSAGLVTTGRRSVVIVDPARLERRHLA